MTKYYCKWCGRSASSERSLESQTCRQNPNSDRHEVYEGGERSVYTCKYCGKNYDSIRDLTSRHCSRGPLKNHVPAV